MVNPQVKLRVPVTEADHAQGPDDAPLTLVEYGDYECAYCGQAYAIVKQIQDTLSEELRFVFRNFPLTQVHPHAMNAARAAEAAGLQRRFWEMHDALYENQENLDDRNLIANAVTLGLDLGRFTQDFAGQKIEDRIVSDIEGGARSGVNGTPTFFVNGFRFEGNWIEGELLEALYAASEELSR